MLIESWDSATHYQSQLSYIYIYTITWVTPRQRRRARWAILIFLLLHVLIITEYSKNKLTLYLWWPVQWRFYWKVIQMAYISDLCGKMSERQDRRWWSDWKILYMSGERLVTQIHLILFRLPGTEGRVFEKKEEEHTKKDCMFGFIHSTLFLNFYIWSLPQGILSS